MTTAKCRDCQFMTGDFMEQLRHTRETGHRDWALMERDEVIVDWVHVESSIVREKPESAGRESR